MPTYGYECIACSNQFETFQSIKDDALTTCEACGGTLRKRIYPVGIAFKGSGFYVNDYAAKSAAPVSAEGSGASGSESKSETKSDSTTGTPKAETKTETKPATEAKTPAAT